MLVLRATANECVDSNGPPILGETQSEALTENLGEVRARSVSVGEADCDIQRRAEDY